MAALLVVPGRWFRNRDSGLVCCCQRVKAPWVSVRYQHSKVDRRYSIECFVLSFESILNPTI
jgi:hypothetical protein